MSPKVWFRRGLLKCLYAQYCHSEFLKKIGRLALWVDIAIFLLQFAETQVTYVGERMYKKMNKLYT